MKMDFEGSIQNLMLRHSTKIVITDDTRWIATTFKAKFPEAKELYIGQPVKVSIEY